MHFLLNQFFNFPPTPCYPPNIIYKTDFFQISLLITCQNFCENNLLSAALPATQRQILQPNLPHLTLRIYIFQLNILLPIVTSLKDVILQKLKKTKIHYLLLRGFGFAGVAGTGCGSLSIADLALGAEHRVAVVVPAGRLPLYTLHWGRVRLGSPRHCEL